MGKQTSDNAHPLRGRLLATLIRTIGALPLSWLHALGRLVGSLLYRLPNRARHVTRTNLQLCLPNMESDAREQLCRQSLQQTASGMLELAWVWRHPDEALACIRAVHNDDALRATLANGQSAIILAPHLGNWEVLNFWLSKNFDLHAMFLPSGMAALDTLIRESREHFGSTMHPATAKGVVTLVRALKKHDGNTARLSAILPDQVPDRRSGRFAPFFGQPAATGTLPVKLLQQTGARAFMAFACRTTTGEFEIILREPDAALYSEDMDAALAALNRSIEALIMEAPAQYLWNYQRFRRVPPGGSKPY